MNNQHDIDKYKQLADRLSDNSLEHAKETARTFALRYGQAYVVIKGSGYQIWSKYLSDKFSREYIYCTEGDLD